MRIGIYFYNIYDLIYVAGKLKDLGLRCRADISSLKGLEEEHCDIILRLLDDDKEKEEDINIIYSGIGLFTEIEVLKKLISDKELLVKSNTESYKTLFFLGDSHRNISALGGHIIFSSIKEERHEYQYLPEYLGRVYSSDDLLFVSKSILQDNNLKGFIEEVPQKGIVFDCQCKNDILKIIKDHNITLHKNLFLGGVDLIEAIYTVIKEEERNEYNYLVVSSSKGSNDISMVRRLFNASDVEGYCLNAYTLLVNPKEEKNRAISYLAYKQEIKNICLATAVNPEDVINLDEVSIMINTPVEELKRRIEKEIVDTAIEIIRNNTMIKGMVFLNPRAAFKLAKAIGLRSLEYNRRITEKWTYLSGKLEERKIDILINMNDKEEKNIKDIISQCFLFTN